MTKNEQMDIAIRYWDTSKSRAVDRYFTSEFLGHATAENLVESFTKATDKLDSTKMVQVSMDGPSVNHKFLRLLEAQRTTSGEYIN